MILSHRLRQRSRPLQHRPILTHQLRRRTVSRMKIPTGRAGRSRGRMTLGGPMSTAPAGDCSPGSAHLTERPVDCLGGGGRAEPQLFTDVVDHGAKVELAVLDLPPMDVAERHGPPAEPALCCGAQADSDRCLVLASGDLAILVHVSEPTPGRRRSRVERARRW